MTVEPIHDRGQKLSPPYGKVIGVVDTQDQFDRTVTALQNAGFENIKAVQGEEGVHLFERFDHFLFGEAEEPVLQSHIAEMKAGHFVIVIKTPSDQAEEAARIASENGARFLFHFGMAAVTWLEK